MLERYLAETAGIRESMAVNIALDNGLSAPRAREISDKLDNLALKPFSGTTEELSEFQNLIGG